MTRVDLTFSSWRARLTCAPTLLPRSSGVARRAHTSKVVIAVIIRPIVTMVYLSRWRTPTVDLESARLVSCQDAGAYDPIPVRGQGNGTPLSGASWLSGHVTSVCTQQRPLSAVGATRIGGVAIARAHGARASSLNRGTGQVWGLPYSARYGRPPGSAKVCVPVTYDSSPLPSVPRGATGQIACPVPSCR
jgi:hypothetical protein